jgi:hypothetical protein
VRAVFHAGTWTRESGVLAAAQPITVGFAPRFENGTADGLEGVDASGHVVWRRPEYHDPSLEGQPLVIDGAMTIAAVCAAYAAPKPGEPTSCSRLAVVGLRTTTGEQVWSLGGFRFVVAFGDGRMLTQDGPFFDPSSGTTLTPGWVLMDDRTGRPVDDTQHWTDPDAFRQACCGESEYVWVSRSGGVLFARNNQHLRVWYPPTESDPTVAVALP